MHGPSEMTLEHYRGEKRANGFETIDNLMHPKTVRTANPLDAYLSHYNQLVSAGHLMFPDASYEQLFFGYARNNALVFVPEQWEVEFVTVPYWRSR